MAYGSALVDNIQSSTANTPVVFKDGNGTQVGTLCRAWVNFNGTGTVAIRASFNVSSITDNGTGDYTINFTNALPDTNYTITTGGNLAASAGIKSAWINAPYTTAPTTTAIRIITTGSGTTNLDFEYINVAIHR